jgi:hypothetical protein
MCIDARLCAASVRCAFCRVQAGLQPSAASVHTAVQAAIEVQQWPVMKRIVSSDIVSTGGDAEAALKHAVRTLSAKGRWHQAWQLIVDAQVREHNGFQRLFHFTVLRSNFIDCAYTVCLDAIVTHCRAMLQCGTIT